MPLKPLTKSSKSVNVSGLTVKLTCQFQVSNPVRRKPLMTYITPSLIISKEWKRLVVLAALTSLVTTSMPLRAIAAEVMVPVMPTVQTDASAPKSTAPIFTVPVAEATPAPAPKSAMSVAQVSDVSFNPAVVREQTSGYKVVRVYNNVPSTAYTSRPQETDDTPFIAADGTHVYDGMVAANFLKFGTKIRIPEMFGDKVFTVHDRMNKRYDVKVDVWMSELRPALQYGVRHVTIEVVEDANKELAKN
jgi:3D (Asp-Asp-Asp) domain-containing protein